MLKLIYKYIRNKNIRKKINNLLWVNEFLDKFSYEKIETSNSSVEDNKYIWQLWLQGEENVPSIVRKCLDSVKRYCPSDYKVLFLDKDSIKNYIEIDANIEYKYENNLISNAHYSDYIRTCLLAKYGGIWIDSTVLLTDNIPKFILAQDFFVFKNPIWFINKVVPNESLFKVFLQTDKDAGLYGSSWFILSKPNSHILKIQKDLLEKYWKSENKLCHYFLYHFFISKTLIKDNICKNIFENMYSLSNREPHILQQVLMQKYDKDQLEEIKKLSSIHKLTYKFDKIEKGSFLEFILGEKI